MLMQLNYSPSTLDSCGSSRKSQIVGNPLHWCIESLVLRKSQGLGTISVSLAARTPRTEFTVHLLLRISGCGLPYTALILIILPHFLPALWILVISDNEMLLGGPNKDSRSSGPRHQCLTSIKPGSQKPPPCSLVSEPQKVECEVLLELG